MERPPLDRIVILLSAAPIALGANILRITVTGMLSVWASSELAHRVYHDLAGWLMMPLAVLLLWLELRLLDRLLIPVDNDRPLSLDMLAVEQNST